MSDYFCSLSSLLDVPKNLVKQADNICKRAVKARYATNESLGFCWEAGKYFERDGIHFYEDTSAVPEDVEMVAREIIEKLKLDVTFYCSWAYTCTKLILNAFDGGAFRIQRGKPTLWVHALQQVMEKPKKMILNLNGGVINVTEESSDENVIEIYQHDPIVIKVDKP